MVASLLAATVVTAILRCDFRAAKVLKLGSLNTFSRQSFQDMDLSVGLVEVELGPQLVGTYCCFSKDRNSLLRFFCNPIAAWSLMVSLFFSSVCFLAAIWTEVSSLLESKMDLQQRATSGLMVSPRLTASNFCDMPSSMRSPLRCSKLG